jgi:ferritin-like metal-binding protein YciE
MNNELHRLFLDELADIYHAENQLVKALPRFQAAATTQELREAFGQHLEATEQHVKRLEEVFQSIDAPTRAEKCEAMEGLLAEGDKILRDNKESPALDAALIAAAQKVEHYEIATYGCLCTWAEAMGHERATELLQETLDEEKSADSRLTEIAEFAANPKAEEA